MEEVKVRMARKVVFSLLILSALRAVSAGAADNPPPDVLLKLQNDVYLAVGAQE